MKTSEVFFEQGPIRPPSEAMSLLVRVARNCPWNRCAFCPVYKHDRYSRRTVDEVLGDIDAMARRLGDRFKTVFLQDADPLSMGAGHLVRVVTAVREKFPAVTRVTTYARSRTLSRMSLQDLRRIRSAGLNRLHVGLESGSREVLEQVKKGVSPQQQVRGCQDAKEAGFDLCVYVMPGLGGKAFSSSHARETANVIRKISPDFVRLRSTAVIPGTPLHEMTERGDFLPLGEIPMVAEIRQLLEDLEAVDLRMESDHVLNLLMEIRGTLPRDRTRLLEICDDFLGAKQEDQLRFILARRLGWMGRFESRNQISLPQELESWLQRVQQGQEDPDAVFHLLRTQVV